MAARAERVDVVVTGVRDASPGGFVELASELRDMTGLAVNQVQVALLKGELIVRRSMAASEAQRAVDELKGLGAEVEVRPAGERGQISAEATESQALTLEIEPDPEIDFTGDPLTPPPSFGELSPLSHEPTDIIPGPRSPAPAGPPGVSMHPMPPGVVPMHPLAMPVPMPGVVPMHPMPMPPVPVPMPHAVPMHPLPGPPPAPFAPPSRPEVDPLGFDALAQGLESPEVEPDDEPPPVESREVKAELEEVDSGRSKPRRPITRGIEDVVVEEIEVDAEDSAPTPIVPTPRFAEPRLELDLPAPAPQVLDSGASMGTTSSSILSSGSSLVSQPVVDERPRRAFGADPIAATAFALAVGLGLGAVVAHAAVRSGARTQMEALEAELGESFTRPLAVREGKLRDPATIEAALDDAYGHTRRDFMLWWLGLGVPLGLGLSRLRRPGS